MISDRRIQEQRRTRVEELLQEGLTTGQVSERTGMTQRSVLRLKKQLEDQSVTAHDASG